MNKLQTRKKDGGPAERNHCGSLGNCVCPNIAPTEADDRRRVPKAGPNCGSNRGRGERFAGTEKGRHRRSHGWGNRGKMRGNGKKGDFRI